MAEAGDYLEPEINFPIDFDLVDDMMDPHPPPLTPKQLKRLRRRLHLPKAEPMAKEGSGGTVEVDDLRSAILIIEKLADQQAMIDGWYVPELSRLKGVLAQSGRDHA